jgi:hypothetical protein
MTLLAMYTFNPRSIRCYFRACVLPTAEQSSQAGGRVVGGLVGGGVVAGGGLGLRLVSWTTWRATPVAAIRPTIIVYVCSELARFAMFWT